MLASLPSIVSALAKEADESSKKPVETSINDLVDNLNEAPVATLDASSGSGSGAGGITRAIPASSGASAAATAIPVSGEFDGKITYYDRSHAITLKQKSGTSTICGGGAFHAADKDNYGPRNVVTDNAAAVNGGVLYGINTNYGDTGTISNACQDSGKNCDLFDNFNSLTAFPSSHPVFSNFMKGVQINEAQEAIDPVAEFAFEDSFKSATNIKSREQVPS
ncbi:putative pectate lyase [Fusarium globosum]|uniref:Pectate lyase n=1 Tax=Fusarium globosum TaxID=78864 RepID=A0A8H5YU29_9HYPO|nr:putative pectate lyase [Fusarium globosum]